MLSIVKGKNHDKKLCNRVDLSSINLNIKYN